MVGPHAGELKRLPFLRVGEGGQGTGQGTEQRAGRVVLEQEPVSRGDGVGEPPDLPDHRHRAVPQAVHLIQAARLVARGHQEEIGAAFDPMRQPVVVAFAKMHPARMRGRQPAQHLVIVRLARPENDILFAGQLLKADRTLGMETRSTEPDIGAHAVAITAIEPGRRIDEHGAGIHFAREPHGRLIARSRDDGGETGSLRHNMCQGLVHVRDHFNGQYGRLELGVPILLFCRDN